MKIYRDGKIVEVQSAADCTEQLYSQSFLFDKISKSNKK